MPLTEDSRNGILAVFVLIGFVLLLIFVPHEWLRPAAIGGLVLGVLSVLGCRQYLRRLHGVIGFLSGSADSDCPDLVDALLSPHERRLLGLRRACDCGRAVRVLRSREALLESLGLAGGVAGLIAFLLLLKLYDL